MRLVIFQFDVTTESLSTMSMIYDLIVWCLKLSTYLRFFHVPMVPPRIQNACSYKRGAFYFVTTNKMFRSFFILSSTIAAFTSR